MSNVSNRAPASQPVHFRTFSTYSCGDTIGQPQSNDAAEVTCLTCLGEWLRLTESRYAGGERR